MKAESTIKRMIRRLLAESKAASRAGKTISAYSIYDMACTLQWVVERTDWTPMTLAGEAQVRDEKDKP